MKLDEISSTMLAQAIDIYLHVAYADTPVPERIARIATVDTAAPLSTALERDCVERIELPDYPHCTSRYRWRLGNARYHHMKLGLGRCSQADDFVFVVDTHDRELPVGSAAYQDPAYQELCSYNGRIKHDIETLWERAGIPTLRGHITAYLHQRCALGRGQRKTILIVDDDESILELVEALVEEAGYRVIAVSDALNALSRVKREGPVDLCLLDIMMPSLDGHSTARQLRQQSNTRFPIIYVTALPRETALDDVGDGYIAKPFDPDQLIDAIQRYIG